MPVPIMPCHKQLAMVESSTLGGRFIRQWSVPNYLDTHAGETINDLTVNKFEPRSYFVLFRNPYKCQPNIVVKSKSINEDT